MSDIFGWVSDKSLTNAAGVFTVIALVIHFNVHWEQQIQSKKYEISKKKFNLKTNSF